jgi:hypothetical protein
MTPEDFLDKVVTENVVRLCDNRGSLRHAVNALFVLDAFAGILFASVKGTDHAPCTTDAEFREILARECSEFCIVRDAAFSLKHGELSRGRTPRLVRKAAQVQEHGGGSNDPNAIEPVVWIEAEEPMEPIAVDVLAHATLTFFQGLPARYA